MPNSAISLINQLQNPLRLIYRDVIKKGIHKVVTHPEQDVLMIVEHHIKENVASADQENVRSLIIEELRRLHEGILARYSLKLTEFIAWKKHQSK